MKSQFVGQTHLALGYGNSHPPLYNWLITGALALTGGYWPAAVALVKNLLLAGTYLLAFDTARRVTGRALTGLIVVGSFMLLPQIVWKSQITLAHSVLVMFAVVASMHAVVRIARRGDLASYLWLGLAAAIGALAKYNFLLVLGRLLIAAFSIPYLRARLFTAKARLCLRRLRRAVHAASRLGAAAPRRSPRERMAKLERDNAVSAASTCPGSDLDGFLALLVAIAAWAGPLLLAWFAIRYLSRDEAEAAARLAMASDITAFAQLFGRTTAIGVGAFAAILLLGDLHSVHERYITPMLMPLALLAGASLAAGSAAFARRSTSCGSSAAAALLMVTAWPLWIAFGREQFAYPYAAFAAGPERSGVGASRHPGASEQIRRQHGDPARLAPASGKRGTRASDQVVVLWDAKSGKIRRKASSPNSASASRRAAKSCG